MTKSATVADLNIDACSLYLLTRKSAEDIRDDVLARAEAGQAITHERDAPRRKRWHRWSAGPGQGAGGKTSTR